MWFSSHAASGLNLFFFSFHSQSFAFSLYTEEVPTKKKKKKKKNWQHHRAGHISVMKQLNRELSIVHWLNASTNRIGTLATSTHASKENWLISQTLNVFHSCPRVSDRQPIVSGVRLQPRQIDVFFFVDTFHNGIIDQWTGVLPPRIFLNVSLFELGENSRVFAEGLIIGNVRKKRCRWSSISKRRMSTDRFVRHGRKNRRWRNSQKIDQMTRQDDARFQLGQFTVIGTIEKNQQSRLTKEFIPIDHH